MKRPDVEPVRAVVRGAPDPARYHPNGEAFRDWAQAALAAVTSTYGAESAELLRVSRQLSRIYGLRNDEPRLVAQTLRTYLGELLTTLRRLAGDEDASDYPASAGSAGFSIPAEFWHLAEPLAAFHDDTSYDRSVFVMMRFPEAGGGAGQALLEDTFAAISAELARHGLVARRADQRTYAFHRQLWDNLCVYMIGCRYGVAVLEDRASAEFNPNVAFEYGFMRALGREVVLLKERSFSHIRADFLSELPREFVVDPAGGLDVSSLRDALRGWLVDIGGARV